jgi:pimeloyl-ACP methyl ester carboxylesterase
MPPAPSMDYEFESNGLTLRGHLAQPPDTDGARPGLVLCHGFPVRGREAAASGKSFPELADRIATEMGWQVLTLNFRGCGQSEGNFSMAGWRDDIHAAVEHLHGLGIADVWLAGTGTGGALCLIEGAQNQSIVGVAVLASPADFQDWAKDPRGLLKHARTVGVVKDASFPANFDTWAAELKELNPEKAAAAFADRSLLVLHGDSDDLVPSTDARAIAHSHGNAELRVITGGGHELRHDPRAVAILLGWLTRDQDTRVRQDSH